nr:polyprotein [Ipomoea batatas]
MRSRNLLGGGYSLSFRDYRPLTTEQRRAAQQNDLVPDEEEQEIIGVIGIEEVDWDGLDFPEPEPYIPVIIEEIVPELPAPQLQQHLTDEVLEFRREAFASWDYGEQDAAFLEYLYYSPAWEEGYEQSEEFTRTMAILEVEITKESHDVSPNDGQGLEPTLPTVEGGTSTPFQGEEGMGPEVPISNNYDKDHCCIMCNSKDLETDKILCQRCMDYTDSDNDEEELRRRRINARRLRRAFKDGKKATPSKSERLPQVSSEVLGAIDDEMPKTWDELEELAERIYSAQVQQPADPQPSRSAAGPAASASSPYRPPEDISMGQPSYAPARTNVEISPSSRAPSFRTDSRFLRRGVNDEVWTLPAAQQQGENGLYGKSTGRNC